MTKNSDTASCIFFSADNEPFVAKEPLELEEREKLERCEAEEIRKNYSSLIDEDKSRVINMVTPMRSITPDFSGFVNELAVEPCLKPVPQGYKEIFFPCLIEDESVPLDMRKLGVKLRRKVQSFYIEYSEEDNGLVFFDEHGVEIEDYFNNSDAYTDGLEITFYTPRFFISEEENARLKALLNKINHAKTENEKDEILDSLSDKDYALYDFYDYNVTYDKTISFLLSHELKHIKNELLLQNRPFRKDYAAMSTKDLYLLGAEDERSAYLESLFFSIKTYLEKEDYADTSWFEAHFMWLAEKLENKSPKQIKAMLYPPDKIINAGLKAWNEEFFETYIPQFKENLLIDVQDNPLVKKDINHKEYELQRRLIYTFKVYNPYTKKEEVLSLADKIKVPVPMTDEVKREIILPAQKERQQYHAAFKEALGKHEVCEELLSEVIALANKRYNNSINSQVAKKLERTVSHSNKTHLSLSFLDKIRQRLGRL